MSFQFKLDEKAANSNNFGGKKTRSGIHKLKIEAAYLGQTKNGNNVIDLVTVNEAGGKAIIFGHCIDENWTSGAKNSGYNAWQELALIAGMKTGQTVETTRMLKGVSTPAKQFAELVGRVLTIGIQEVYSTKEDGVTQDVSYKLSKTFRAGDPAIETTEIKDYFDKRWTKAKAEGTLIVPDDNQGAPAAPAAATATEAAPANDLF